MNDYENKISNLFLTKITEFTKENKILTKINTSIQIELKSIKATMRNVQNKLENLKGNYKKLQWENKYLLANLQYTNKLIKNNDIDYSKELPRETRQLVKENSNSSTRRFSIEGLLTYDYI